MHKDKRNSFKEEIESNSEYWEKILGTEVCRKIVTGAGNGDFDFYCMQEEDTELQEMAEYSREISVAAGILQQEIEGVGDVQISAEDRVKDALGGSFACFYEMLGRVAVRYGEQKELGLLQNRKETILADFYRKVQAIPLRVLIQEIHRCKDEGLLSGETREAEYEDYCNSFLKNKTYLKELFQTYPEMHKLLCMQVVNHVMCLEEIVVALEQDKEKILATFPSFKAFHGIGHISCGQSDAHRQGRTVAIVSLDNGEKLVYKPRGLGKEAHFEAIYERFCKQEGLTYSKVKTLDRGCYGWQEYVPFRECREEEEVRRYFRRMGILLFLCYCLNAGDIHGENVRANGEYPVLLDLEVLPGYRKPDKVTNAEEQIREELKASVLSIGILPVPMWQQDGQGVIINALHDNQRMQAPFRIPMVMNPQSSDICIGYRRGEINLAGSMPSYQGSQVPAAKYIWEICQGFEGAYRFWLGHRTQLTEELQSFMDHNSRYLLRHTQQYSMILQMSYYPEFLKSEVKRRLFLHTLDQRSANDISSRRFLPYEREALYRMNIPAFYAKGKGRSLYDYDQKEYPDTLKTSIRTQWLDKASMMNEADRKKQLRLIKLSLALFTKYRKEGPRPESDSGCQNSCHDKCKDQQTLNLAARKAKLVTYIADQVCNQAVIYQESDINFCGLRFRDEDCWSIAPLGMYLYDGIAGIAIFMATVMKWQFSARYVRVWSQLIAKMFRYTKYLEAGGKGESEHVGAFVGEGSMVNAYLSLYELTKDPIFIEYAKRHSSVVMELAEKESCMDFLSGCAGAIVVLLKLFGCTREVMYLIYAQRLEEKLWSHMEQVDNGSGWSVEKGTAPLAGMAHGNSGLLLAYAYLMEAEPLTEYQERIKKLLAYEDGLFDEKKGNWKDLRHEEGERKSSNAWCHGANGILLARLRLLQVDGFRENIQIHKDIQRCAKILMRGRDPQEICLCHGLAGDYCALAAYGIYDGRAEVAQEQEKVLLQLIEKMESMKGAENMKKENGDDGTSVIRMQEWENPALMMGMTGVGLAFNEEKCVLSMMC